MEKHGHTSNGKLSPEYGAWMRMIQRCENPNHHNYNYYGARGIRVCKRWRKSFLAFFEDMGERPSENHSIDRIDVNGNYEPGNCRWATSKEQNRNTRRNRYITDHNGKTQLWCDWRDELGLTDEGLRIRLLNHSEAEAVSTHENLKARYVEHNGKRLTITEWAKRLGRSLSGIRYRLSVMPVRDALKPKK